MFAAPIEAFLCSTRPAICLLAEKGAMSGKAESAASAGATDRAQSAQRFGSVLALPGVRQVPASEIQIFLAIIVLASIFSYAFPDSFATSGTLLNMARVAGIMLVVS